jgi:hypothetical protein
MPTTNPGAILFGNARREAFLAVLIWLAALLWTVGYCYLRGYVHSADSWLVQNGLAVGPGESFHQFWGLPSWVLFGIIVPWLIASVVTLLFARFIMADDDLGREEGGAE